MPTEIKSGYVSLEQAKKLPKIYKGRKLLSIPYQRSNLTKKVIQDTLPDILKDFYINSSEYVYLEEYTKGKQDVINKERKYEKDINNIVIENHALSMVQFKQGYMYGNEIKYSMREDSDYDQELSYLKTYIADVDKPTLDNELAWNLYIGGQAFRMVLPNKKENIDLKKESPFKIYNLENTNAFVVYSSTYTKEKLYGAIVSNYDEQEKRIYVYTEDTMYTFSYNKSTQEVKYKSKEKHIIGYIPIVEYTINKARLGIVEVVKSLLDAANAVSSNCLDNVEDFVNSILVIYNQEMTSEDYQAVKEAGALILKSNNPNMPAEAKYLVNVLNLGDVTEKYEKLLSVAYDIVGVPRASVQFTSGGDTGQARLLGGGWTRADIVASQDEISLRKSEKKLIDIILSVCKQTKDSLINSLSTSDISIKFPRNNSDNLLVKTQSLQTLIGLNMPKEIALNMVNLTSNNFEVANMWEQKEMEMQEKANAQATKEQGEPLIDNEKQKNN